LKASFCRKKNINVYILARWRTGLLFSFISENSKHQSILVFKISKSTPVKMKSAEELQQKLYFLLEQLQEMARKLPL